MKLETVIFCEDIRHEINNKHSLIGMYNDRIVIKPGKEVKSFNFPVFTRLSCFCRFISEPEDSKVDEFEFSYLMPKMEPIVVSGPMKVNMGHKYFTLTIAGEGLPLQLGDIGYRIVLKSKNEIVKEITEKKALTVILEMPPTT
jgi:hypothetical protein